MKKKLLLIMFLMFCSYSLYAAKITRIVGEPQVKRSWSKKLQKAVKGMPLVEDDIVVCNAKSRAEILLDDGHKVKMWPRSKMEMKKLLKGQTKIKLMFGKLRSWVKKLRKAAKFEVKTPVAVCSVRGTDFSVEVGENNQVKVEVYEGLVAAVEEKTGKEVVIQEGQYSQIIKNQAPTEPQDIPEETKDTPEESTTLDVDTEQIKEEAKREIFQEIAKESVIARAAEEIKIAEYQNGKSAIDVSGKRVRMEEYIVRGGAHNPSLLDSQFKYVVLNTREDRFDFGKMLFTFNTTLPEDLTQATKTMFTAEGSVAPTWYLTEVDTIMSNTVDKVNEAATGGQMFADNSANPKQWNLGFATYEFSVNDTIWWSYADSNRNGQIDSGEITYFDITTGNQISFSSDYLYDSDLGKYYYLDADSNKVYFSEFDQPTDPTAFHFRQKNNYSTDQWIQAEDYIINDNGEILTLANLQNLSSTELEQQAYESNFERIYTCSVFEGRKIDLVFSAKLLIDAGILNLSVPSN